MRPRHIVSSYSLFDSNETSTWVASSGPERLAKLGRLLPTRTGANVILAQPFDPIVFDRLRMDGNYPRVSVAQTAIDLLTGNARMPEEGKALLGWMQRNESAWRSDALGV